MKEVGSMVSRFSLFRFGGLARFEVLGLGWGGGWRSVLGV